MSEPQARRNEPGHSGGRLPALITGASGGIGADLARVFARNGHAVALVARSRDRLEALKDELVGNCGVPVTIGAMDLGVAGAADELAIALRQDGFTPGILVNNAGFGLADRFADQQRQDQLDLIDLNIRVLTELTHVFLPQIIAAKGSILNVASVAAFYPGPGMAVYYASKAYVLSLSEAIACELKGTGVTVSVLCPGPTESAFLDRAGIAAGKQKAKAQMASMPVAMAGYRGMIAGKKVIVPGVLNKIFVMSSKAVPHWLSMPIIARLQMKRRAE